MSGGDAAWLRWKVSDAAASDDIGEEQAAVAADAFNQSSAVKHIHSRFNNSAKRPH